MKWYVVPPVFLFGLNCVLATLLLSLAIFHLYTDKSTNAPIVPNEEWICRITGLIPFSATWIVISVVGMFASMARNRIWLASLTLVCNIICLAAAIYFTLSFGAQLGMEDVTSDVLFNITKGQIIKSEMLASIPDWLENVQKQSHECCGIVTYRDYEEFWPEAPTKLPRSCCRERKMLPSPCPTDLTQIPFPHTPAIFYKVENGCMDEINESARRHIQETFQSCIVVTVFISLGVCAFVVFFVKRYLVNYPESEKVTICLDQKGGGGDAPAPTDPAQTSSDLEGINSIEGVPAFSADSMPDPKTSGVVAEATLYKELKDTNYPRNNVVFAGLRQQFDSATGEEMTVQAQNIARQEVFIVQDPYIDPQSGRLILQSDMSNDDLDKMYLDDGGSPPGSPGGRRRRERRHHVGIAHKNHHHHHKEQPL